MSFFSPFSVTLSTKILVFLFMEKYIVSARKYRPSTFKTIVGQHALANTLKNAVLSNRLAHSYLFCGQRGVGKTTTARIFAKAINCEHLTADGEPCNECESCRAFNEQRSMNIIELDAASNNSVDDIRDLTEQVLVPPVSGKYRVFIIDEVHMLSSAAFNAFLKTLEEPPAYVIFILATTEKHKILPTILSRCQKYDFASITPEDIAEQLRYVAENEGYTTEPSALNIIAQKADGAMRDALSIFDQVAASSMGNITYQSVIENLNLLDYDYYFRLVEAFLKTDVEQSLLIFKEVRDHGFEGKLFINGLASHFRELLVAHSANTFPLLQVTQEVAERYKEQSARCDLGFIYSAMEYCNKCDLDYRVATNKQFLVELTLIKICQLLLPVAVKTSEEKPLQKLQPSNSGSLPQNQQAPSAPAPTRVQPQVVHAAPAPNPVAVQPAPAATVQTPAPAKSFTPSVSMPKVTVQPMTQPVEHLNNAKSAFTGRKLMSIPSISISKPAVSQVAEVKAGNEAPKSPVFRQRSSAYTDEDVREAWRNYVISHPIEFILINAMEAFMPQPLGNDNYLFQVENQSQMSMVDEKMGELMTYIRGKLDNDNFTLVIKEREKSADEKIWTQKELLIDVVERRKAAKDFIKKYHLGFA